MVFVLRRAIRDTVVDEVDERIDHAAIEWGKPVKRFEPYRIEIVYPITITWDDGFSTYAVTTRIIYTSDPDVVICDEAYVGIADGDFEYAGTARCEGDIPDDVWDDMERAAISAADEGELRRDAIERIRDD